MEIEYYPILKTTDAELRGYGELDGAVKSKVLPIFELTKSRKTKLEPYGNIEKRLDKIIDLTEDRPFILDLTTEETLVNYQIEDLLDPVDGFENWSIFIQRYENYNIIPVVHVDVDNLVNTTVLANTLATFCEFLALRISDEDTDFPTFLAAIDESLHSRIILIIDAGLVKSSTYGNKLDQVTQQLTNIPNPQNLKTIVTCSSSFPSVVAGHTPTCEDDAGYFPYLENKFTEDARSASRISTRHGDFGSVHPIRYKVGGGNWIPRIDYPRDGLFYYTRIRRNSGGYVTAARRLKATANYIYFDCWGCDEIEQASTGTPNGKSPAYWIAARINMFITHQVSILC